MHAPFLYFPRSVYPIFRGFARGQRRFPVSPAGGKTRSRPPAPGGRGWRRRFPQCSTIPRTAQRPSRMPRRVCRPQAALRRFPLSVGCNLARPRGELSPKVTERAMQGLRRFGDSLPTVVPAGWQALSCPPTGALPRNRLASSATGGASAISPLSRLRRQLPQRGSQGCRRTQIFRHGRGRSLRKKTFGASFG